MRDGVTVSVNGWAVIGLAQEPSHAPGWIGVAITARGIYPSPEIARSRIAHDDDQIVPLCLGALRRVGDQWVEVDNASVE